MADLLTPYGVTDERTRSGILSLAQQEALTPVGTVRFLREIIRET